MEKMQIGRSSVWSPRITLGAFGMGGGTAWQDTTQSDSESVEMIRAAHELYGICSIDTAPVYGTGRSERIVGEAVRNDRENYVLQTKCSLNWRSDEGTFEYARDGERIYRCFSREALIKDCEDSLRRMGTDYIDILIIHRCPGDEEMKTAMETMEELKRRGLIRAVGLSNAIAGTDFEHSIELACSYGELDLLQEAASLLKRKDLDRYLRSCEPNHITFQNYTALERGALAGKLIENIASYKGDNRAGSKWFGPEGAVKINALTKALQPVAERHSCTIPVLCLAWVLLRSKSINLLVGARRLESVADTVKALDVKLSSEDIAEMNRLADIANA